MYNTTHQAVIQDQVFMKPCFEDNVYKKFLWIGEKACHQAYCGETQVWTLLSVKQLIKKHVYKSFLGAKTLFHGIMRLLWCSKR